MVQGANNDDQHYQGMFNDQYYQGNGGWDFRTVAMKEHGSGLTHIRWSKISFISSYINDDKWGSYL